MNINNLIRFQYMADVTVGAKLELDANDGINSMKELKNAIREAQGDLIAMRDRFGETSKEAIQAAKRVEELTGNLNDARDLVNAFDPDKKFVALSQSLNGVLGGFTALNGAMGLLGVESEDVQKQLLKVQSALALSQGLSQVGDAIKSFRNLGAVIQATTLYQKANAVATNLASGAMRLLGFQTTATSTAMSVLKGAIIATGIGALVVLLGVAADAMGLFSSSTDDAADAQKRLGDEIQNTNDRLSSQTTFLNREEKLELARAANLGKSEQEIFNIQDKYRLLRYNNTVEQYNRLRTLDEAEANKALQSLKDQEADREIARLNFEKRQNELAAERARKARENQLDPETKRVLGLREDKDLSTDPEILFEQEKQQILLDQKAAYTNKVLDLSNIEAQVQQANAIQTAETERVMAEARITAAQSIGEALGQLSNLVGRQTAVGKALGIAQATINTFIGVTEVLRAKSVIPEPFGTISKIANVAAIIAAGISAVRNIVRTPVPGFGAAGGGGGNIGSVSAPVPARPTFTNTRLDQQQLNQIGNATVRAYVTEVDVTNNQEKIRRLNRAARI